MLLFILTCNCRYQIQGKDQDWEKVQVTGGSNIVNIPSSASTKKRKTEVSAADLGADLRGDKNGVYDPKGMTTKKEKKSKSSSGKKSKQ